MKLRFGGRFAVLSGRCHQALLIERSGIVTTLTRQFQGKAGPRGTRWRSNRSVERMEICAPPQEPSFRWIDDFRLPRFYWFHCPHFDLAIITRQEIEKARDDADHEGPADRRPEACDCKTFHDIRRELE